MGALLFDFVIEKLSGAEIRKIEFVSLKFQAVPVILQCSILEFIVSALW